MSSRRNFIQLTSLGLATAAMQVPLAGIAESIAQKKPNLSLGIAGYTFSKIEMASAITMMKRLDVSNLSLKDVYLPLSSSDEKIRSVVSQLQQNGINIYTVGVIYMKTREAVDQAFDYAKKVGVNMIVGVPTYDLLDYAETKVKLLNLRLAIHNHGPEDELYPGPQQVYDRIKNRDPRMGLCLDIGHATRAGVNPARAVKAYKDRLFDLHIKDVTGNTRDAKTIEIGRGVIDFEGFMKALRQVNYKGVCSFEFEKDMQDPLPGLAESMGFFKGTMALI
ncbi:MAG: sugar phosphate isomerase/epimerase family protein [Niastella sp.]|uniref:sugar phosphate isomerase/epimerase family protein n=1 Tax=Niastella sp. TaxID=1869183 RepID=UPI0038998539